ncbi:MAG: tRNA adenosine(34) deaminase TadA [Cyanobacteria bacterium]|nr:tRNA adenosine(34) deaminase TadA [Cyanobacteriota bacterium]
MAAEDITLQRHQGWMAQALTLAEEAGQQGEVPVGALVVSPDNQLVATGVNRRERDQDPTAHAEVLALRAAGRTLGNWNLTGYSLYVTLEPCPMCAGAIVLSRVSLLVYGAADPKTGAVRSVINVPDSAASNHRLAVLPGVLASPCQGQLRQWFAQLRQRR